jgi:hypothetical protein
MSEISLISSDPPVHARVVPALTWAGKIVESTERVTHYLHLAAFACERCNGPIIVGWLGTRQDNISKETDLTRIGAACLACGFRLETIGEASVGHHFRPVEWEPAIHKIAPAADLAPAADAGEDQLAAELSQDADTNSMNPPRSSCVGRD